MDGCKFVVMVNEMALKKFEFMRHVLDDLTEAH